MDTDYSKLPPLENIYLEDSWVLKIDESSDSITFTLDAVLTEAHSNYSPPKAGEQYCYRRAVLEFTGITEFQWHDKDLTKVTIDASGTQDHGNIDTLGILGNGYYLAGDFGQVKLVTRFLPKLTLSS